MTDATPSNVSPSTADGTIFIPDVIPIFPLPTTVLLPGEVLPLHIFEPRYRTMLHHALNSNRLIGIVELAPDSEPAADGRPAVRSVGCVGIIGQYTTLDDGRYLLWLVGLERFEIREELERKIPYRMARVDYLQSQETTLETARIKPLRRELRQVLPSLFDTDEKSRQELEVQLEEITDTQLIALASQVLELPANRKRELLEAGSLLDLYTMVFEDLFQHLDQHPEFKEFDSETLN